MVIAEESSKLQISNTLLVEILSVKSDENINDEIFYRRIFFAGENFHRRILFADEYFLPDGFRLLWSFFA